MGLKYSDALTGAFNDAYLKRKIISFDREKFIPLSVIACNIDGLKLIKDTLGDSKGEALIEGAANLIRDCVRSGDIIVRTQEDRFIILLLKTNSSVAQSVSARIQDMCRRKQTESGTDSLCVCLSIGHATKVSAGKGFDEVLRDAEENMYKQKYSGPKDFHISVLNLIKEALFSKSHETEEHLERLVSESKLLGLELGLTEKQLNELALLATLHDIGKVSIDKNILTKPGKLDENEWNEIKRHPETGYEIAITLPQLEIIAEEIRSHHERWDGGGYPQGMSGENIPLLSRIIAVVDAFDAMTSERCYRKAVSVEEALDEIKINSGAQFDPLIAETFIGMKRIKADSGKHI
jgi:diguanylate cyclase (GGDEF)-like protein